MYVCLRGRNHNKSLDCFGSALCVVIGLRCLGYDSILTLSEDHAYESHYYHDETEVATAGSGAALDGVTASSLPWSTCEVAIPGTTKAAQDKRGREIHETFKKKNNLSAATSWLYMANSPVRCTSMPMSLAAAASNINCSIDTKTTKKSGSLQVNLSRPLLNLKRTLLWTLYDAGHLATFPFALMELGDCEEHLTSPRGEVYVEVKDDGSSSTSFQCLKLEALYHEAIHVSRRLFNDGQAYPYCYMGNYHKDAGQEPDQEYRLVEALRCYAQASRVASGYIYEWGDSLQLTKVVEKLAEFIRTEILTMDGTTSRSWANGDNHVAAGTWLVGFLDSLLLWEERTGNPFLSILTTQHKSGISKLLAFLPQSVRMHVAAKMAGLSTDNDNKVSLLELKPIISPSDLHYFTTPRSQRFGPNGLLLRRLKSDKGSILEMDLAMVMQEASSRSLKRVRRQKR